MAHHLAYRNVRNEPAPLSAAPTVSIGLPVFNGERFLAEALRSLLAQTFGDFELIISDNASTDRTADICTEFARRDSRIRYIRQARNLGAARNWNFVVLAARGRFFKWASANDRCEATLLEDCVRVLRDDARVVLCYGNTLLIDDDGNTLGEHREDPEIIEPNPCARFIRVVNELHMNNAQAGVIRASALRRTRLERAYSSHSDLVLMAELVILGGYRKLPQVLLHRRLGRESATRFLSESERQRFMDPLRSPRRLIVWRKYADYAGVVLRSDMSIRDKSLATIHLARRAVWERHNLWRDLWRWQRPIRA